MESIDEEGESYTDYRMRTEKPPVMHCEYKVTLLNGNHGIWLFVSKEDKVVMEQAGIKTIEEAFKYALAVINSEEKDEAKKQEARKSQETQAPDNMG